MLIDFQTSQCFIHSQLKISEMYSNCITSGVNLEKVQIKKILSIIASTCTGIHLIYKKSGRCTIMPIDSQTSQCFIHSQLKISELYSNCTT